MRSGFDAAVYVLLSAMAGMLAAPAAMASSDVQPVSTEMQAPGPDGALAGTMLDAGKGTPVVLFIQGSGAVNRDGNTASGVHTRDMKLLAEGLAAHGISSVRTDKRGMFGSSAAIADANKVTIADYAHDVGSWISVIRQKTDAPCVWVLGHSEGGLVALVAAQSQQHICGLVLISAAGRLLDVIMKEQLRANPALASYLDGAFAAIDSLKAGKHVTPTSDNPLVGQLFNPAVQDFEIDLFSHDPAKLAAAYKRPLLLVGGTRDIQVPEADLDALAKAQPDATVVRVADMNHVMKVVKSDDRAANIATYSNPDLPLAPGLVGPIAQFIATHAKAR